MQPKIRCAILEVLSKVLVATPDALRELAIEQLICRSDGNELFIHGVNYFRRKSAVDEAVEELLADGLIAKEIVCGLQRHFGPIAPIFACSKQTQEVRVNHLLLECAARAKAAKPVSRPIYFLNEQSHSVNRLIARHLDRPTPRSQRDASLSPLAIQLQLSAFAAKFRLAYSAWHEFSPTDQVPSISVPHAWAILPFANTPPPTQIEAPSTPWAQLAPKNIFNWHRPTGVSVTVLAAVEATRFARLLYKTFHRSPSRKAEVFECELQSRFPHITEFRKEAHLFLGCQQ